MPASADSPQRHKAHTKKHEDEMRKTTDCFFDLNAETIGLLSGVDGLLCVIFVPLW
jgi:hypothetical protein